MSKQKIRPFENVDYNLEKESHFTELRRLILHYRKRKSQDNQTHLDQQENQVFVTRIRADRNPSMDQLDNPLLIQNCKKRTKTLNKLQINSDSQLLRDRSLTLKSNIENDFDNKNKTVNALTNITNQYNKIPTLGQRGREGYFMPLEPLTKINYDQNNIFSNHSYIETTLTTTQEKVQTKRNEKSCSKQYIFCPQEQNNIKRRIIIMMKRRQQGGNLSMQFPNINFNNPNAEDLQLVFTNKPILKKEVLTEKPISQRSKPTPKFQKPKALKPSKHQERKQNEQNNLKEINAMMLYIQQNSYIQEQLQKIFITNEMVGELLHEEDIRLYLQWRMQQIEIPSITTYKFDDVMKNMKQSLDDDILKKLKQHMEIDEQIRTHEVKKQIMFETVQNYIEKLQEEYKLLPETLKQLQKLDEEIL